MWERLSLNLKLRISFGIVALLLICVGIVSTIYLNNTVKTFQHVSKISLANVITISGLDSTANRIQLSLLQMGLSNNPKEIKSLDESIKNLMISFEETQKKYESIPFVKGEEILYKEFKSAWDILKVKFIDLKALANDSSDEAIKKFSTGYIEESKNERDRFEKAVSAIINFQSSEGQMWAERANTMAESAKYITTTIIIIAVIAAFVLALFISSNLTTTLRGLSLQIADGSHTLAETASEISSASESLSSSVHEQAAAIQETSASAEELTAMVTKTEENAHRSYEISKESSLTAEKGKKAVEDVIHAINRIHTGNEQIATSVTRNNQNIEEINKVILDITEKTKIINEIVFQTKLLSFNASVEAARAGEQGKGFAVVAEEVGNLAAMSGNAAQDISQMLSNSTIKVQQIVQQTKDEMGPLTTNSKKDVENGIKIANECGRILNEIVSNVMSVDSLIREITEASKESAKGIQEITKAMGQLDQATQMNSTAANQSSEASRNLSDQASSLSHVSQTLKLTIEGRA